MTDLQPNIQDLQKDVIDLLKEISALMERAKNDLSADGSGDKYGKSHEEVKEAICNVENLELRMAIVAPMKAGKSTIINAIIGQDLLPSRNAAMTTLPTKILFNSDLNEPILVLSADIISVFQDVLKNLQDEINSRGTEWMQEKIAQYPHLTTLATEIQTGKFSIPKEVTGNEKISQVLTKLNDIVRLCSSLDPNQDPLAKLTDVPCIKTSFWQSEGTEASQQIGHLVIIDTPGPNEAGENLRLTAVVEQELQKSSIVLIILDFTQLNNQAAEQVKRQVEPVVNLIGKENLYVLVNKVDQRKEGDMTPEQVKEFVYADLKLTESSNTDKVFEIAAFWALSASRFLLESQQNPSRNITEMETSKALAQQAYGVMWETMFDSKNQEQLQSSAQFIWNKSGFAPFLEKAIKALMESAAPRCMLSALMRCRGHLLALKDDLHLRSQAIFQDAEKLQQEIDALEADLKHLELCRIRLAEIKNIKKTLQVNLRQIFEQLKQEAQVSIEDYFINEDYERGSLIKKVEIKGIELFSKWILQRFKSDLKYKTKGVAEFRTERDAEEFANQAIAWAKQRAENLLSTVRNNTQREITNARTKLTDVLEKETKPIIERARTRLQEAFNVELVLLPPTLKSDNNWTVAQSLIARDTRYIDQGYGTKIVEKRAWYHWLWLIPFETEEKYKKPDKQEDYYTVSLEKLVTQINLSIEKSVRDIDRGIIQYLDEDFQNRVNVFFQGLDDYLCKYRDSLRQGQTDQRLSLKKRDELTYNLRNLVRAAQEQRKKTDAYIERTKKYLPDYLL